MQGNDRLYLYIQEIQIVTIMYGEIIDIIYKQRSMK